MSLAWVIFTAAGMAFVIVNVNLINVTVNLLLSVIYYQIKCKLYMALKHNFNINLFGSFTG